MSQGSDKFLKLVHSVIYGSNVILYVGDARFPTLSVSTSFLREAKAAKKIVVLGLNKVDLVTKGVTKRWRVFYKEQGIKCIPFSATERLSTRTLRARIVKAAKKRGITNIDLGVVGYPNVGKSSAVNVFFGRRGVQTSATPGQTQSVTKLRITENLVCWDTPGVFELGQDLSEPDKLVLGTIPITSIPDPRDAAVMLINRLFEINPESMRRLMGKYQGAEAFLDGVYAYKAARLLPGGLQDPHAGPLKFLYEYYNGTIPVWEWAPDPVRRDKPLELSDDSDDSDDDDGEEDLPFGYNPTQ